jgi:hypothetical protein
MLGLALESMFCRSFAEKTRRNRLNKTVIVIVMTVTFVPPRTRIRGSEPIAPVHAASSYMMDTEEPDEDPDLYGDVEMSGIDGHSGGSLLTKKLVVPGQLVTDDPQFMR